MLKPEIKDLFNSQINKEIFSAYLYLDIANYYIEEGFSGFGNWFNVQAKEELDHASIMTQFMQNNNAQVILEAIEKPTRSYKDLGQGFTAALAHEQFITESINTIYGTALDLKDFKTVEFLNWFIKEQVEEERNAEDLIFKFELLAGEKKALYMLDKELAARVYSAPSLILD